MQSSNTNPTNEIFDISYSYKKQINKIWNHIKLSADSDPLQLGASKKPNPTKLQMFHNYFLSWLIVFIKKLAHFLFFIIPQRDKNILICTFFMYCRCISSFWCEFDDRQRKSTLLFYQIEPLKNGVTLILPSSVAKNSAAPNAKRIFEILWGILEGRTTSARPSRPCLKNCTF